MQHVFRYPAGPVRRVSFFQAVVAGTPCPSVDLLSCPPSAGNPVPAGMESRRGKVSPANSHYSLPATVSISFSEMYFIM